MPEVGLGHLKGHRERQQPGSCHLFHGAWWQSSIEMDFTLVYARAVSRSLVVAAGSSGCVTANRRRSNAQRSAGSTWATRSSNPSASSLTAFAVAARLAGLTWKPFATYSGGRSQTPSVSAEYHDGPVPVTPVSYTHLTLPTIYSV